MKYQELLEAKFKKPELMYHGTSSTFLNSIKKNGILPSPKEKVWSDDPDVTIHRPSRKSLQGSYWTWKYSVAEASAGRAVDKFGGEKLIILAYIAKQSAFSDEDTVLSSIKQAYANALNNVFGFRNVTDTVGKVLDGFDYKPELKNKLIDEFVKNLHNNMSGSEKHPIDTKFLEKVFWAFFNRLVAHSAESLNYFGYTKKLNLKIPSVQNAEEEFHNILELLTRHYRKTIETDSGLGSLRITEPVTFRGSNKICLIVREIDNYDLEWKIEYNKNKECVEAFYMDFAEYHGEYPEIIK